LSDDKPTNQIEQTSGNEKPPEELAARKAHMPQKAAKPINTSPCILPPTMSRFVHLKGDDSTRSRAKAPVVPTHFHCCRDLIARCRRICHNCRDLVAFCRCSEPIALASGQHQCEQEGGDPHLGYQR
jgi:hypothetical protein